MFRDLRYAARMLSRSPGWTAVVVLSLAIGIGANTALFTAVNSLLLRTLPVNDPDTLVRFRWVGRNDMTISMSDYGDSSTDSRIEPQFVVGRVTIVAPCADAFIKPTRMKNST